MGWSVLLNMCESACGVTRSIAEQKYSALDSAELPSVGKTEHKNRNVC